MLGIEYKYRADMGNARDNDNVVCYRELSLFLHNDKWITNDIGLITKT